MNILSWIFVLELLLLFCAYVAWWAGKQAARERPDDFLYLFTQTFWRTLRQKPLPLRAAVLDEEEGEGESIIQGDLDDSFGDTDVPPASSRRGHHDDPASAPLIRQATLNVRVIAGSARNEIVAMDGGTLKVHVTADAESGSANKAVIDLLISTLGVKTHQILLLRGHFQTQKSFQISGMNQDELDGKLAGFE